MDAETRSKMLKIGGGLVSLGKGFSPEAVGLDLRSLDTEMQVLALRLGVEAIPIELHIHSGGGDLFAGLAAIDTIQALKSPIHTYVQGSVASAASLMSICGTKRFR